MNPVSIALIIAFLIWLVYDNFKTPIKKDEPDDTTDFYNN